MLTASTIQLLNPSDYEVDGINYSEIVKVSLDVQQEVEDASREERLNYIKDVFFAGGASGLKVYDSSSTDITNYFDVSLDQNEFLAEMTGSIVFRLQRKQSFEFVNSGTITVDGVSYKDYVGGTSVDSVVGAPSGATGHEIFIRSNWSIDKDIFKISKIFIGVVKIIFNILVIGVTIGRPFLPEWMKLRAAWMGQTVMLFQLNMYTGLTTGTFGGIIDDFFRGFLWNARRLVFLRTSPNFVDKTGFVFYKYYENHIRSHLLEECFVEVVLVLGISIIAFFIRILSRDENAQTGPVKIISEISSSIFMFTFVPILVHYMISLFTFAWINDRSFFTILDVIVGTACMMIYFFQLGGMIKGTQSIQYLHEVEAYDAGRVLTEQGLDWGFDTFASKDTNIGLRCVEIILFACIPVVWASGQWALGWATLVIALLYIALLFITITRYHNFDQGTNERMSQRYIMNFTLIHYILKLTEFFLIGLFWLLPKLKIWQIKIMTWVHLIVFLANLYVLVAQMFMRLFNLFQKPEYYEERANLFGRSSGFEDSVEKEKMNKKRGIIGGNNK